MNLNPQEQPQSNTNNFYAQGMADLNEIMVMGRNDHERSSAQSIFAKYQRGEISGQEFARQIHEMKEGKQDYN